MRAVHRPAPAPPGGECTQQPNAMTADNTATAAATSRSLSLTFAPARDRHRSVSPSRRGVRGGSLVRACERVETLAFVAAEGAIDVR